MIHIIQAQAGKQYHRGGGIHSQPLLSFAVGISSSFKPCYCRDHEVRCHEETCTNFLVPVTCKHASTVKSFFDFVNRVSKEHIEYPRPSWLLYCPGHHAYVWLSYDIRSHLDPFVSLHSSNKS